MKTTPKSQNNKTTGANWEEQTNTTLLRTPDNIYYGTLTFFLASPFLMLIFFPLLCIFKRWSHVSLRNLQRSVTHLVTCACQMIPSYSAQVWRGKCTWSVCWSIRNIQSSKLERLITLSVPFVHTSTDEGKKSRLQCFAGRACSRVQSSKWMTLGKVQISCN
jgi:hypothetical protein